MAGTAGHRQLFPPRPAACTSRAEPEARQATFEWIEIFYDRRRIHSTLGYQSPAEYEQQRAGARSSRFGGALERLVDSLERSQKVKELSVI